MLVYQANKFGQIYEMHGFLECSPSSPHRGRSGHVESGAMLDGTDKATPTKKRAPFRGGGWCYGMIWYLKVGEEFCQSIW